MDQATNVLEVGVGTTVVLAGGPFLQRAIRPFEAPDGVAPLFAGTDGFVRRDTGQTYAAPNPFCLDEENATADSFIVEIMSDPGKGALVVASYGWCGKGTVAAGVYFTQTIAPNISTDATRWWLVQWIDDNGDLAPNAGDVFAVVASGD